MKKKMIIGITLIFILVGCNKNDNIGSNNDDKIDYDPCSVDMNSDECKNTYPEKIVYEYSGLEISTDSKFQFNDDEQGFVGVASGSDSTAKWDNTNQAFVLGGTNNNNEISSYMFNKLKNPREITHGLSFLYKTGNDVTSFRVRIIDRFNKEKILMDWTDVQQTDWTPLQFDLTEYKGQTIVIYFEQKAKVSGSDQKIYIDDLRWGISAEISNKTKWTFDTDIEEWIPGVGGKNYDKAIWESDDNGGYLLFDGSDYGQVENPPLPNAWFMNSLYIDSKATSVNLNFKLRTPEKTGATFRIRVFDEDAVPHILNTTPESVTVGDFKELSEGYVQYKGVNEWQNLNANLDDFIGQTIVIFLEHNSSIAGMGEYIYIDDLELIVE